MIVICGMCDLQQFQRKTHRVGWALASNERGYDYQFAAEAVFDFMTDSLPASPDDPGYTRDLLPVAEDCCVSHTGSGNDSGVYNAFEGAFGSFS